MPWVTWTQRKSVGDSRHQKRQYFLNTGTVARRARPTGTERHGPHDADGNFRFTVVGELRLSPTFRRLTACKQCIAGCDAVSGATFRLRPFGTRRGTISGNSTQQLALWLYKPKFKVHAGSKVHTRTDVRNGNGPGPRSRYRSFWTHNVCRTVLPSVLSCSVAVGRTHLGELSRHATLS